MIEIDTAIGRQIKYLREKCRFTQSKLADRLNVTVELLDDWERGAVRVHADYIRKIVRILEVDLSELYKLAR